MGAHTDRTHTRTAAAVRDAKSFVEIEMADVRANVAGTAEADLRVEVGAVHVNLSAGGMHHVADFADAFLEHAVRGRIGDHERGEFGSVLFDLLAEVGHVDIALRIASNRHDGHSGHDRAGRVGAVGGGGDEADGAVLVTARVVVGADDEQSGVFALRTGIGLERDGGEARDFGEPRFELTEEFAVAGGMLDRGEGMQVAEFGPGDRNHFSGSVELHGA